jgi:hypothetical protein
MNHVESPCCGQPAKGQRSTQQNQPHAMWNCRVARRRCSGGGSEASPALADRIAFPDWVVDIKYLQMIESTHMDQRILQGTLWANGRSAGEQTRKSTYLFLVMFDASYATRERCVVPQHKTQIITRHKILSYSFHKLQWIQCKPGK